MLLSLAAFPVNDGEDMVKFNMNRMVKIILYDDLTTMHFGIHPKELKIYEHTKIHTLMFITVFFMTDKI